MIYRELLLVVGVASLFPNLSRSETLVHNSENAQTTASTAEMDEKTLVRKVNNFGGRYFEALVGSSGGTRNVASSGFNTVRLLLLAALTGDEAQKRKMVAGILNVSEDKIGPEEISAVYREFPKMIEGLRLDEGDKQVLSAVALFTQKKPSPTLVKRLEKLLGVQLESDPSVRSINSWVSEKTKGQIKDLLSQSSDPTLVATLYMSLPWENRFNDKLVELPFKKTSGVSENTPMMTQNLKDTKYLETDSYQMVSLPFQAGTATNGQKKQFFADFILPKEASDMKSVTDLLKYGGLQTAVLTTVAEEVDVTIPVLDLKTSTVGAKAALAKAGVPDFTILGTPLDQVVEKGVIKMDPKGAKVSLATAFITKGMRNKTTFIADRPYVIVLRDSDQRILGQLLVNDPKN